MRMYAAIATLVICVPLASAERRRAARPHPDDRTQLRASAPEPPRPPPRPSITLRQGVVAAALSFELSVSSGNVAQPASVAPDVSVGVTDDLTFAIIHSGSALSGFRGGAGAGFCVSDVGADQSCHTRYTGGGIEAFYAMTRGSAALAADVGVLFPSTYLTVHTDLKLGFKLKMSEGNVFALFSPNVWLALDDRYDRVTPHEHQLFLPISLWVKPAPPLALGVGTGVKGPLENFADRMAIPIGVLVQYAFDPRVSVGSSLVFGKILGGADVMNPGLDARVIQVWINVSSN